MNYACIKVRVHTINKKLYVVCTHNDRLVYQYCTINRYMFFVYVNRLIITRVFKIKKLKK